MFVSIGYIHTVGDMLKGSISPLTAFYGSVKIIRVSYLSLFV